MILLPVDCADVRVVILFAEALETANLLKSILFTTLFLTGAILFLGGSAQGEDVASEDAAQGEDVASGDAAQAESTSEEDKDGVFWRRYGLEIHTSSRTWDLKATRSRKFCSWRSRVRLTGIAPFLQRVVDEAEEQENVVAILTEIHTPGERVDAAVEIKNALLQAGSHLRMGTFRGDQRRRPDRLCPRRHLFQSRRYNGGGNTDPDGTRRGLTGGRESCKLHVGCNARHCGGQGPGWSPCGSDGRCHIEIRESPRRTNWSR